MEGRVLHELEDRPPIVSVEAEVDGGLEDISDVFGACNDYLVVLAPVEEHGVKETVGSPTNTPPVFIEYGVVDPILDVGA